MESHADGTRLERNCVEARVAVLSERLVEALAAEAKLLCDLDYSDRAGNIAAAREVDAIPGPGVHAQFGHALVKGVRILHGGLAGEARPRG